MSSQAPLFIVSTGRCGSTMLSRLLAQHPDVASLSELFNSLFPWTFLKNPVDGPNLWHMLSAPRPHHKIWLRLLERGVAIDEFRYPLTRLAQFRETGIPPLLTMTLPEMTDDPDELHEKLRVFVEALPRDGLGAQYGRVFEWLVQQLGRRLWVERSGSSLGFLDGLMFFFPTAKFVHIYRDGREFALSASKFPPMRLSMISRDFQAAVGKTLYEKISPKDVPRIPEAYRPLLAPDFDIDTFLRLTIPIERFGALWSDMIVKGNALLAKLPPERLLNVRYESVLANPEIELRRFIRFLDPALEQDSWIEKVIPLVRSNPPKWTALPSDERTRLEKACAPGMEVIARLR